MKFSGHIEAQVNKANRLLGLIRRSFVHLDGESMRLLFTALVRPHLEYGNSVWRPHLERDKKLIEGVLRRATRVIPGMKDMSYEQRLEKMRLPSMAYRRVRGDMIEVYKYTHGLYSVRNPLFACDVSHTRGHPFKLLKPRCQSTLRQCFFSQRVIDRWNRLPREVVTATTVNSFKNRLDKAFKTYMYRIEEPPAQFWSKDQ